MKRHNMLAGFLALTIATISSASFADSRSYTYIDQPITNIPHHSYGQPRVNASINVIESEGLGSRPAIRVERRSPGYYNSKFEKSWGKDWKKKHHYKVIVVKPGDSLSKIAARYGTTVKRLMKLNNISAYEANHIEIGQMLRIS